MMLKNLITGLFLVLIPSASYSQDSLQYQSKWLLGHSIKFNTHLTPLSNDAAANSLFGYGYNTFSVKFLSAAYFFSKQWGAELSFEANGQQASESRKDDFVKAAAAQFANNYFVTSGNITSSNIFSENNDVPPFTMSAGIVYRKETGHFLLLPKFSLGFTQVHKDWGYLYLKEKNSNNVLYTQYDTAQRKNTFFTLALSTIVGYKISKRTYLSLDVSTSYFKPNITINKKTTDLYTNKIQSENINFHNGILTLNLGLGITYSIK